MELTNYDGEDPIGEETLEALAGAHNFNKWMYDTIAPYVKGELMEMGNRDRNVSAFFLNNKTNTTLTKIFVPTTAISCKRNSAVIPI